MTKEEAERELKQQFRSWKINRDAFHTEANFVQTHIEIILEKCGGTWDNQIAAEFIHLLKISH